MIGKRSDIFENFVWVVSIRILFTMSAMTKVLLACRTNILVTVGLSYWLPDCRTNILVYYRTKFWLPKSQNRRTKLPPPSRPGMNRQQQMPDSATDQFARKKDGGGKWKRNYIISLAIDKYGACFL